MTLFASEAHCRSLPLQWSAMNHVRLHTSADPAALAHAFASATPSDADPFARPLLLTPTPGVQRWLSQQVATTSLAGAGIMAGYDVHPWSRLEALLSGSPTHEDAWAPTRMVWAILAACERHAPGLEALEAHLGGAHPADEGAGFDV